MDTTAMLSPQVSIVIVCMNRIDNLYPCLQSIKSTTKVTYETLVVAYLFTPENLARAKEDFPWVTFIESNEMRGFSENNNLALRSASGKYCFILNDDTEMKEPVIDRLVSDFENLPKDTAIVCPRLENPDGSLQLCGRPIYPAYKYVLQQFHLYLEPKDNVKGLTPVFDKVFKTYNISGAAFLIPTDTFRKLGFFDETYFFTPEDIALSTLANEKGMGVYVDAGISVTHKWRTTASRIMPATRPAAVRGSLLFWSRGSNIKYFAIGFPVWCAETCKLLKAAAIYIFRHSEKNLDILRTFRNNASSIFSRKTPKEIFVKCYRELSQ